LEVPFATDGKGTSDEDKPELLLSSFADMQLLMLRVFSYI
jgi:hypothetical protein